MVVSQEMEHPVDKEEGEFVLIAVSKLLSDTLDFVDTDDDTAKRCTGERITRKTEDIGRFVDTAKFAVDFGDFVIIGEKSSISCEVKASAILSSREKS